MPWRRRGKTVYVKKGGKWKKLKAHPSVAKAEAHKRALYSNVKGHK